MRPEFRWALAAIAALGLGALLAEPYARLAAPYYAMIDRAISVGHPWQITYVGVQPGRSSLTRELQLQAFVRRKLEDTQAAARVIGRVQVGEVVETPIVFWTLVLLWPAASLQRRALRALVAIPVFLGLEAITTAAQLIVPMAQASAILAGDKEPNTRWDQWSQFLETGGQFVLVCVGAIALCALASKFPRETALSLTVTAR